MTTRIHITGLAPKLTQLLRARTMLQQSQGSVKIGRTVVDFEMTLDEALEFVQHLITAEIPGSGASSNEVKRLRDLRHRLIYPKSTFSGVKIFEEADAEREQLLDLIAELYAGALEKGWDEVDDIAELMAGGPTLDQLPHRDEFRAWISEKL